jgi:hypothetical protein
MKQLCLAALVVSCAALAGCGGGEKNPLLGAWHVDSSDSAAYVRLGISLITSGKPLAVVFGPEEMTVDFGRGVESLKVTYTQNTQTKAWSFCLNNGNNCFPATFLDENKQSASFAVYGVTAKFKKQPDS